MPAKAELAGEQFRKALALEPKSYDANHNLGEFYIQTGKVAEAQPFSNRPSRSIPIPMTTATTWPWRISCSAGADAARQVIA